MRNLGWKLAAHFDGWAGANLLDSYSLERQPVFASTAKDFIANYIEEDRAFLKAYDPNRDKAAFEAAWAARSAGVASEISGFEPNYEGSPIVFGPQGGVSSAVGDHRWEARAGHHLAPQMLAWDTNVFEALGEGFTLFGFGVEEDIEASFGAAAEELGLPLKIVEDTREDGPGEVWARARARAARPVRRMGGRGGGRDRSRRNPRPRHRPLSAPAPQKGDKGARMFRATVFTLMPDMFPGPLGASLSGDALARGLWSLETRNIRDHGIGRHRAVDDTPAGGGPGMVIRADVLAASLDAGIAPGDPRPRLLMSPRGRPLRQDRVRELAAGDGAIVVCGRFEGVDERVIEARGLEEVSIGDYVLSGGEIAAHGPARRLRAADPRRHGQERIGRRGEFRGQSAGISAVYAAPGVGRPGHSRRFSCRATTRRSRAGGGRRPSG